MPGTDDIFITATKIEKLRHLAKLTIPISETERRHLILTGANGSGKTSLLEAMNSLFGSSLSSAMKKNSLPMPTWPAASGRRWSGANT